MGHPIGSAVALLGVGKRHAHDLTAACGAEHAQRRRRGGQRAQTILETEIDQDAGGVRGELDAGAGFLEPLGLFQHHDPKAVLRERQCRSQAADPGAGDDDGARGRQSTSSRGKFR